MSAEPGIGPHAAIALVPSACTSCMICVRECPAWCIEIDSHVEEVTQAGARRPRSVSVLDSFSIDFGLCMYCGICIDVCPFDALAWVPTPLPPGAGPQALVLGTADLAGLDRSGPAPPDAPPARARGESAV